MKRGRVVLVLVTLAVAGCRTKVSLGTPDSDGGTIATPDARTCPAMETDGVIAWLEPAIGELRALAAHAGLVVAAFARPDGSGMVARASEGSLVEIAEVGGDPVAVAFDGTNIYVACRASARVDRLRDGEVVSARSQAGVSSIAIGVGGRALWTRPADGEIVSWAVDAERPGIIATFPRAQSIAEHDGTIYFAGLHRLARLGPGEVAPTKIADVCGPGAIAVEGDFVYCLDDGVLQRINVGTRVIEPLVDGIEGATDVLVARGRAFFRRHGPERSTLEAVPTDGIGGRTLVDVVQGAAPMATDGCSLYYSDGSAIHHRSL